MGWTPRLSRQLAGTAGLPRHQPHPTRTCDHRPGAVGPADHQLDHATRQQAHRRRPRWSATRAPGSTSTPGSTARHAGYPNPRLRRGLASDRDAVAGLAQPWSSGPVEGKANRIKTIKRQMYGRATRSLRRQGLIRSSHRSLRAPASQFTELIGTGPPGNAWTVLQGDRPKAPRPAVCRSGLRLRRPAAGQIRARGVTPVIADAAPTAPASESPGRGTHHRLAALVPPPT